MVSISTQHSLSSSALSDLSSDPCPLLLSPGDSTSDEHALDSPLDSLPNEIKGKLAYITSIQTDASSILRNLTH